MVRRLFLGPSLCFVLVEMPSEGQRRPQLHNHTQVSSPSHCAGNQLGPRQPPAAQRQKSCAKTQSHTMQSVCAANQVEKSTKPPAVRQKNTFWSSSLSHCTGNQVRLSTTPQTVVQQTLVLFRWLYNAFKNYLFADEACIIEEFHIHLVCHIASYLKRQDHPQHTRNIAWTTSCERIKTICSMGNLFPHMIWGKNWWYYVN